MLLRLAGSALTLALLAAPAAEARDATPEERTRIEEALRGQGFQSWGSIGMEDGVWEVDDASRGQGARQDIRLTPDDLRLIDTAEDDRVATTEETARITEALRGQGFREFGRIRLEDGVWEVDKARATDGTTHDLTLERQSLRILHRERDN